MFRSKKKLFIIALAVVFLMAMFTGCDLIDFEDSYDVSGVVEDEEGEGLGGIELAWEDENDAGTVETRVDGAFAITDLVGEAIITPVALQGYEFEPASVTVTEETDNITFVRKVEAVGAIDPADIDNEMVARFDASELEDGLVSVWEDLSGSGNDAVANNVPLQVIDGLMYFEGITDKFFDVNFDEPVEVPWTIFMTFQMEEEGTIFDDQHGANRVRILYHGDALRLTSSRWDSQAVYEDFEVPSEFKIGTFAWAGEEDDDGEWIDEKGNLIRLNGEQKARSAGTENMMDTLRIGSENGPGNPFTGVIGEIIIFKGEVEFEDMAGIETYLTEKWEDIEIGEPKEYSAIDPADIDNMIAWYDASELEDGEIDIWEDLSGNEYHAVHDSGHADQSEDEAKPVAEDGTLKFDNSTLTADFGGDVYENPYTAFYIVKVEDEGAVTGGIDDGNRFRLLTISDGTELRMADSNWDGSDVDAEVPTPLISITSIFDDHDSLIRKNFQEGHRSGFTDDNLTGIRFGGEQFHRNHFTGELNELIIFDGRLDEDDIIGIEIYLMEKWL